MFTFVFSFYDVLFKFQGFSWSNFSVVNIMVCHSWIHCWHLAFEAKTKAITDSSDNNRSSFNNKTAQKCKMYKISTRWVDSRPRSQHWCRHFFIILIIVLLYIGRNVVRIIHNPSQFLFFSIWICFFFCSFFVLFFLFLIIFCFFNIFVLFIFFFWHAFSCSKAVAHS